MLDTDSFNLSGYRRLLRVFDELGYTAAWFTDKLISKRSLILRHDIDFDPAAALQLGSLEAENNWASTYFVLLTSPFYNVHEARTREILKQLLVQGHAIGLHFDVAAYGAATSEELEAAAHHEALVLSNTVGEPVRSVSFHRPSKIFMELRNCFGGMANAYAPRFFSEIAYVSDSQGQWRHGHPLKHSAVAQGEPMQLLTHPIWWCREVPQSPSTTLDEFLLRSSEGRKADVARNCGAYTDVLANTKKISQ